MEAPKKTKRKACDFCQTRKIKCVGFPCSNCSKRNIQCKFLSQYTITKRKEGLVQVPPQSKHLRNCEGVSQFRLSKNIDNKSATKLDVTKLVIKFFDLSYQRLKGESLALSLAEDSYEMVKSYVQATVFPTYQTAHRSPSEFRQQFLQWLNIVPQDTNSLESLPVKDLVIMAQFGSSVLIAMRAVEMHSIGNLWEAKLKEVFQVIEKRNGFEDKDQLDVLFCGAMLYSINVHYSEDESLKADLSVMERLSTHFNPDCISASMIAGICLMNILGIWTLDCFKKDKEYWMGLLLKVQPQLRMWKLIGVAAILNVHLEIFCLQLSEKALQLWNTYMSSIEIAISATPHILYKAIGKASLCLVNWKKEESATLANESIAMLEQTMTSNFFLELTPACGIASLLAYAYRSSNTSLLQRVQTIIENCTIPTPQQKILNFTACICTKSNLPQISEIVLEEGTTPNLQQGNELNILDFTEVDIDNFFL